MSDEPAVGTLNHLAAFCKLVQSDTALQQELRAIASPAEFLARTVALGLARGFEFLPHEVEAELQAGRRRWIERGLR